jgi:hypothetical protein
VTLEEIQATRLRCAPVSLDGFAECSRPSPRGATTELQPFVAGASPEVPGAAIGSLLPRRPPAPRRPRFVAAPAPRRRAPLLPRPCSLARLAGTPSRRKPARAPRLGVRRSPDRRESSPPRPRSGTPAPRSMRLHPVCGDGQSPIRGA